MALTVRDGCLVITFNRVSLICDFEHIRGVLLVRGVAFFLIHFLNLSGQALFEYREAHLTPQVLLHDQLAGLINVLHGFDMLPQHYAAPIQRRIGLPVSRLENDDTFQPLLTRCHFSQLLKANSRIINGGPVLPIQLHRLFVAADGREEILINLLSLDAPLEPLVSRL